MNQLVHFAEFQQALKDYSLSDEAKAMLQETSLVLLAAPTAVGRNTIIKKLVASGGYHYAVSDTTRVPRINDGAEEKNGEVYWFISEEEFLQGLQAGKYIEAAIIHNQQVSGISIKEIEKAHNARQVAISDVEIKGVETIIHEKPDTIAIFVLPPSLEEWHSRISRRGKLPQAELKRRIQSAYHEFNDALHKPYYYFVINEQINQASQEIQAIVRGQLPSELHQNRAKQHVSQLLDETKAYLIGLEKNH